MQTGTVSGLWLCQRSWGLIIDFRENFVHIWKSYFCSHDLDVQETNISFTQFDRSWNYFSWCRFTHGWTSRSGSLGFGYCSIAIFLQPTTEIQRERAGKLALWHIIKNTHQHPNHDSNSAQDLELSNVDLFPHTWILLVVAPCCSFLKITKRWSRWSSREEVQQWDMFPENPQSRAWLVVWQNQLGPTNPN